jgi:hypothetical protein
VLDTDLPAGAMFSDWHRYSPHADARILTSDSTRTVFSLPARIARLIVRGEHFPRAAHSSTV